MDPEQQQSQPRSSQHPSLHSILPPQPSPILQRTANSTPVSSPGLFSPTASRLNMTLPPHAASECTTPAPTQNNGRANMQSGKKGQNSPFLHPLQTRKVIQTFTANVDRDFTTGRKHINQYEVMEEIGRGQHGKVKLARNLSKGENVAIKIIPRFSKKRRLGKVTAEDPQRNTKREIAILKKILHPNVVALLEVIDDPELKKIYMVLEHVALGEIIWRKKGLPHICQLERRRVERAQRNEPLTPEEAAYLNDLVRRAQIKEYKRERARQKEREEHAEGNDYWSLELTPFDEDDLELHSRGPTMGSSPSLAGSRATSQAPSRTQSAKSLSRVATPSHPSELDLMSLPTKSGDFPIENPAPLRAAHASATALDGTMFGAYSDDTALRARSPSMADSIISHMSSVDFSTQPHDPFVDDYSYVPCFTMEDARSAFRDTVLGLEYLHYNGIVHRDIKPANLLWTREHQVKISDFGVSYFGRPVRDGEPVELVSESEALDWDDDRELAKTVGTPAFFAPELCYTELDKEQPRVSEQIDVWSLGVTLFCIIFARIPFLAEDEFSMFRKIATEDVFIPRRRLRPVLPFTDPTKTSFFKRGNYQPYRDDEDASYEDIGDDLFDLLRRMLLRNPDQRIRLSAVKRHPWVVKDIPDVNRWLEETDPSRESSGRQIEVDEKEIGRAVVPLTFLERAKSAVKKAVGKVIHRSERGDGSSRRRADSSAASSAGDSVSNPSSAHPRDARRKSIRGDDYFATVTQMPSSDHPLSQSITRRPQQSTDSPAESPGPSPLGSGSQQHQESPGGFQKPLPRQSSVRVKGNSFLSLTPALHEARTVPPSPRVAETMERDSSQAEGRAGRETCTSPDASSSRARSLDRAALLFSNLDKHSRPEVGLSTTVVPGKVQQPPRSPRPVRSVDLGAAMYGFSTRSQTPSPGFLPRLASGHTRSYLGSDPVINEKRRSLPEMEERPSTAHRVEAGTNLGHPAADGRHESERPSRHLAIQTSLETDPTRIPCPPSPNGDGPASGTLHRHAAPSREETMSTAVSSSATSLGAIATPLTSPSVVTSPVCHAAGTSSAPTSRQAAEAVAAMLAFQSDPSLPALLSGASSVSADAEGDFLGNPGVVDDRSSPLIATSDSLTPPAPAKESLVEFPLVQQDMDSNEAIPVRLDPSKESSAGASTMATAKPAISAVSPNDSHLTCDGDDCDSDSDEGLMMSSKKNKKGAPRSPQLHPYQSAPHHQHQHQHHHHPYQHVDTGSLAIAARRRDTNTSIGSTETAKKVDIHGDVSSVFNSRTD